jgi:chromosomal replication initiator protein
VGIVTPLTMIARVAVLRGVPIADIRGPSRYSRHVKARHEAMWLIREATELSFPEIGRLFRGRDHTTVIAGVRRIRAMADNRPEYRKELLSIVSPPERPACVSCSGCIPHREAA